MPAKKELTEQQIAEIPTLAVFLTQEQISDYFGVSRKTFHNMRERDERIDIAYKKGKARGLANVADGLYQQAIEGNITAQMFYLKTQGGWREKQDINHVSEDGTMSPSKIELVPVSANKTND
jgi:hypothetical protein